MQGHDPITGLPADFDPLGHEFREVVTFVDVTLVGHPDVERRIGKDKIELAKRRNHFPAVTRMTSTEGLVEKGSLLDPVSGL